MTSGPWWIIEGLLFLHVSQFGFCDYKDNVCVNFNGTGREECYDYGWATFGTVIASRFKGVVFMANPRDACSKVSHKNSYTNISYDGKVFLLIDQGSCDFFTKSVEASRGGFDAAIIRSLEDDDVHSMDEGTTDGGEVNLPAVYVGKTTGEILEDNDYRNMPNSRVYLTPQDYPMWGYEFYMIPFAIIVGICFILMAMFMISRYYRHYLEQRRNRLSPSTLKKIPTKKFRKAYHCKCVDPWLTEGKRTCPVCKRPVANDTGLTRSRSGRNDMESMGETSYEAEPEAEANERTPLISTTSQSRASITMTV
ncbi:E3 ubiquitin-protein ligase RNF13-like [Stylophora pistillata]|uniref:E3 ubiquitin-protein ligase RNF13-like n=1 Tax=Stylophora pistillata TaxID=50429 RepID=UPI000C03EFA9|nr:E3 ubiquitin-protein ligase RNF13-like [Stylophora pistillata]XP_022792523.1 E3 ubiquitin-protein ligase RNF13-like [Stylophora pistillata]